jgi:murein DD-endopeptidase MepM/ murein hydrolase activator NlpD
MTVAIAGSALLIATAVPVVNHLLSSSPRSAAADGGTQAAGRPPADSGRKTRADGAGASEFAGQSGRGGQPHSQWSHVPVAKVTAARIAAAQRDAAARAARAARQRAERERQAQAKKARKAKQAAAVYRNPLRAVGNLILERIDMGVDFGGSGPVYAIGDAVITNADANNAGWPGGGWITYRLTDGPAKGLMVYLAEDVKPTVQVGQNVTSSTVIGNMFNGGAGIETGWAKADASSAESQLAEAGSISGQGPFPTEVGLNFEELLQALGVPAAPNRGDTPHGELPSNYPAAASFAAGG